MVMKYTLIWLIILLSFSVHAQTTGFLDSVTLFENTVKLRKELIKQHYLLLNDDKDKSELLTEAQVIDAANHYNHPPKGMEDRLRYKVSATKEGNLYKLWDFYAGIINKSLGYQYFSKTIRPYKIEEWRRHKNYGDARLVYNYQTAKPIGYDNWKASKTIKHTYILINYKDINHPKRIVVNDTSHFRERFIDSDKYW